MSEVVPPSQAGRSTRDVLVLALIVVLALCVRAWRPDALGLGHYDEGVYAISARGAADPVDPHLFPGQVRFSPPLWFMSVSVASQAAEAPAGATALWLNVLAGSLTVLAAGIVGWAWFGPAAGAAGALLLAGSQFQIMLARTALTDPTYTLLMLLAVAALGHGLSRGSLAWSVAGGVLTGLAWNTKYHGWFVLLIAMGAIVAAKCLRRQDAPLRGRERRTVGLWLVASAIAAGMYLPWALYMGTSGGAGGWKNIFEYYLGMIGTEWIGNAGRHVAQQAFLEGSLSRASAVAAVGVGAWLARRQLSIGRTLLLLIGTLAAAWGLGAAGVTALLAAAGAAHLLRGRISLEVLFLIGWVALWLVAAPIYRPYARLLLPLGVVLSLLAGAGVVAVIRWLADGSTGHRLGPPGGIGAALAMGSVLLGIANSRWREPAGDPWRDGRGTERAADSVAALVPAGAPIVVIGEPSLAYYLIEGGRPVQELTQPMSILDTLSSEAYLVAGVYADRAPPLREGLARLAPRLQEIARLDLAPTDLRLLDDMAPADARRYRHSPDATFDLRLFKLAPAMAVTP